MRYERTIGTIDASTFGELVDSTHAAALRLATVILGAAEGADDVVQLAGERAWKSIHTYDDSRPFRPWFLRIVANTARNDRRSRGRRAHLAVRATRQIDMTVGDTPEEAAVTDDERRRVIAAMNALAVNEREVIALRYFEELTEAEMAVVLDCPLGTVKSRLSRTMSKLRTALVAVTDAEDVQ